MTLNACLAKSTVVAALGGLLFGFDTAVISGTTAALTQQFSPLALAARGTRCRSPCWGTVLGSLLAGIPGDRTRPPRQPAHHGHPLSGLRPRLRRSLELDLSGRLPLHRRPWHRRLLGARPHVHRRNCSRQMARPSGGILPVQRRLRNPRRLSLQLRRLAATLRRRRMAVEARHHRRPRGFLFPDALRHPPQPALAGEKAAHRRSPRSPRR